MDADIGRHRPVVPLPSDCRKFLIFVDLGVQDLMGAKVLSQEFADDGNDLDGVAKRLKRVGHFEQVGLAPLFVGLRLLLAHLLGNVRLHAVPDDLAIGPAIGPGSQPNPTQIAVGAANRGIYFEIGEVTATDAFGLKKPRDIFRRYLGKQRVGVGQDRIDLHPGDLFDAGADVEKFRLPIGIACVSKNRGVGQVVAQGAQRRLALAGKFQFALAGRDVLSEEDNPADVGLLRRALKYAGLECALTVVDDGADALALVRFGLRDANDPRMLGTLKVIDSLLKVETPTGPSWHRYNDDGYGEHKDGAPFDGTGIGRAWPLLTGERAHYELLANRADCAKKLSATMESFANQGGLIPEQIWDSADLPGHDLFLGKPSGSAMPLVWAHAEYIKLRRSQNDGRVFDLPPQTVRRYLIDKTVSPRLVWRFNHKLRSLPAGKLLRVETLAPATIHWTVDNWKTIRDEKSRDVGLGIHLADLATESLSVGAEVKFTFFWPGAGDWEGTDFIVRVDSL